MMFSVDYPFADSAEATAFLADAPLWAGDREKIAHLNAEALLAPTNQQPSRGGANASHGLRCERRPTETPDVAERAGAALPGRAGMWDCGRERRFGAVAVAVLLGV